MKYKDGVVLKIDSAGPDANILTFKCIKCGSTYRLPCLKRQLQEDMPKFCPYCGKKLVKRK